MLLLDFKNKFLAFPAVTDHFHYIAQGIIMASQKSHKISEKEGCVSKD